MHFRNQLAAFVLSGIAASMAMAQDAATLNVRSLAATCASCHGSEGRSINGSAIVSLAGMPRDYMLKQFKAFKDGSRPATVMHQIAKGYTDQQVEVLAIYFSTIKR